jgi:hypothetical protein
VEGGGDNLGNSNNDGTHTGTTLKEILPFDLNKDDGFVAISVAVAARSGALPAGVWQGQFPIGLSEGILYEGIQDDPSNPIIYIDYTKPKCIGVGSVSYTDNAPPTPYRLNDAGADSFIYQLSASNCKLDNKGLIDGQISGENKSTDNGDKTTIIYQSEYTNFKSGLWDFSVEDFEKKIFSVTGSSYYSLSQDDNGGSETVVRIPREEYKRSNQSIVITNLLVKVIGHATSKMTVSQFQYEAKWDVLPASKIKPQVDDRVALLLGLGSKSVFSKGSYELTMRVTSPLVFDNSLYASSGSATIDLSSHNISADIVYYQNHADVTYHRNGVIKTVEYVYR